MYGNILFRYLASPGDKKKGNGPLVHSRKSKLAAGSRSNSPRSGFRPPGSTSSRIIRRKRASLSMARTLYVRAAKGTIRGWSIRRRKDSPGNTHELAPLSALYQAGHYPGGPGLRQKLAASI